MRARDPAEEARFLVCRAVQLILGGALNDATEMAFAQTLGLSGRHLRRLFLRHLGMTPAALAAAARAHVARGLLATPSLKVSDVAFVVGFGSVRQFNRVMLEIYGLTPQALRTPRCGEAGAHGGGLVLHLPVPRQYDWAYIMADIGRSATPGVERIDGTIYRRSIETVGDVVGLLEVHRASGTECLETRLLLPSWPRLVHVVERTRTMLGLGSTPWSSADMRGPDMRGPGAGFEADGSTRPAVRPAGEWTAYEAAVKAIVGLPDDERGLERLRTLVVRFGRTVDASRERLHRFPPAHALSRAAPAEVGVPLRMAVSLVDLATAVAEGALAITDAVPANIRLRSFRSIVGVTDDMAARFVWLTGGVGAPVEDDPGALDRALPAC